MAPKLRRWIGTLAVAGMVCLPSMRAHAEPIPPLAAIPDGVNAEQRAKLTQQRQALEDALRSFQAAAAAFNAKLAKGQTDQEYDFLQSQRSSYIQSAKAFNQQVDTSVVDARNVPSGLPESVEAQIPHTPAGDRVRKGYQAIQYHDWKVALAWFQDALNHEPGNTGIARLVDLAKYTLQAQQDAQADGRRNPARPISMAAVDKYLEDRNDENFQKQWNDFVNVYLPKHPELTQNLRGAMNAAKSPQQSGKGSGTEDVPLLKLAVAKHVVEIRRAAKEFDEKATENMAYSFALPGGDANPESQRMKDLAVLQSETSAALIAHAELVERCGCAPAMDLPKDSDIKYLFPGTD